MMHWGSFGTGFGGFVLGWIFMVLFWAFVILGVVYLLKQLFGDKHVTCRTESAEDILKRRYASGEVTTDEYYERLRVLSSCL